MLTTWILIVINAAVAVSGAGMDPTSLQSFRLPTNLVPFHYKIKILTKLASDFSYYGKVWIDVDAVTDTDRIVLNSKNLEIYENDTMVEELREVRMKLRTRREATKVEDGSTVEASTGTAAMTTPPSTTDSGIEVKEIKVGVKRPQNSPIKYIYYTVHKPVTNMSYAVVTKLGQDAQGVGQVVPGVQYVMEKLVTKVANDEGSGVTTESMVMEAAGMPISPEISPSMSPSVSPSIATTEETMIKETEVVEESHGTVINEEEAGMEEGQDHQTQEDVRPRPESHEYDTQNDLLVIKLSSSLMAGKKYRIQLMFRGILSDSLTGYYRVPYKKRNSKTVSWLASTAFEPNEARSAFPCFDEPDFKATFDIALAHDKSFTALSNMPLKNNAPWQHDYQWSHFERTPRMSTYLVAFHISDFGELSSPPQKDGTNGTRYKFYSRKEVLSKLRYASQIVPQMKTHLENLLGVKDVLPKYDFVALPSFISNALENWGLVSFAERNILYTPGYTSIFNKFETTQILGHEVSHIWFGNLVTPKYWDQIWLSEGFSNYFEVVSADHVQPSWDVKTVSLVFSYLKVFSLDAMHTSHPLVPKIKKLSDVNEIFDSISYQKGYFLVRMLNYTLGEETFMKGVRQYLAENKLSNVEESDLWDALTEHAHADGTLPREYHLRDVMHSWTRRTGYPVIDVFRDYDNGTAVITQRRFLRPKFDLELRKSIYSGDEEDAGEETRWWIPLTYTTGRDLNFHDTMPRLWLRPTDEETHITDLPDDTQFILMNLEAAGMYRVNYDEHNWELLIDLLLSDNHTDLSVINRVQIIDDLLDFARAGEIPYATAFDAVNYLKKEKSFLPWKAALSNFEYISRMFRSTDGNRLFKKFIQNLVSERFNELGMQPKRNENILDAMNRKQIVKWACSTGYRQCTTKSLALFRKWAAERKPDEVNPIPGSIRSVVYCSAAAHGTGKDWQFLWRRYNNNFEVSDKKAVISGLGCTRNAKTLKKYLDWSLSESSGIKKQDAVAVFKSVAKNDVGFNIAKDFLRTRMGDIKKYLGNNQAYISQMIDALAAKMNKETDLQELEALEEEHFSKLRSAPKSFKQAKERVTFNIDWLEQNYDTITDWLKRQEF